MSTFSRKSAAEEQQVDDFDICELIRRSDLRAREIFEAHIDRPLFPLEKNRQKTKRSSNNSPRRLNEIGY